MKAIMMSIRPQWVAKILNGEKTIEIRKTMPRCDLPIDVYIYCTKGKEKLYRKFGNFIVNRYGIGISDEMEFNGKIVAKFTLNKVLMTYNYCEKEICDKAKITSDEYWEYLSDDEGYAWHIDKLEIFDEPKELSDFETCWQKVKGSKNEYRRHALWNAPQSWGYIEV